MQKMPHSKFIQNTEKKCVPDELGLDDVAVVAVNPGVVAGLPVGTKAPRVQFAAAREGKAVRLPAADVDEATDVVHRGTVLRKSNRSWGHDHVLSRSCPHDSLVESQRSRLCVATGVNLVADGIQKQRVGISGSNKRNRLVLERFDLSCKQSPRLLKIIANAQP